ncbi:hypothetical protein SY88_11445 [Clostridiales bacterium PH28_bin88]|nr:hypothetical protein SY88_11445 [Clostridiales bacterium PH28_bin88]
MKRFFGGLSLHLFKDEEGLTLVEVVVAILILGVALVPVMSMFSSGLLVYSKAKEDTIALALAQGKMEELFAVPSANLDNEGPQSFPGEFASYAYRVEVGNYGDPMLKLIQVTVIVYPQDNPAKETRLVTLMGGR